MRALALPNPKIPVPTALTVVGADLALCWPQMLREQRDCIRFACIRRLRTILRAPRNKGALLLLRGSAGRMSGGHSDFSGSTGLWVGCPPRSCF
jgi:hypothetical protein